MRQRLGADVDAQTLKRLSELSDGWIAGLHLLSAEPARPVRGQVRGQAQQEKLQPSDPLPADHAHLRAYFEHEVLSRLAPAERAMLERVAPCSRFSAALFATLTDQPHAVGDALQLLNRLESDNVFVVAVEGRDGEIWYRLHPMLRATLLAGFSALDEDRQQEMHARAWVWFRDRGLIADAVRHALQAGLPEAAARLLEQCVLSLFMSGERRNLYALLRQLPQELVDRSATLGLWRARLQLLLHELDACARSLDQLAQAISPARPDQAFMLTVLRASLAVHRDDSLSALALLPQLQQVPAGVDALALGGRNNILSWLYLHQGNYVAARAVQADSPPLVIDGAPLRGTAAGTLQGRCLVGLSHALEGRMEQAERIYREVAAEADACGKACADAYYQAIALLADVLYERNELHEARRLLEDRLDVLERITIPDALLRALRMVAAAHWAVGNRLEALNHLERLEDHAITHGLDRLLAHSLGDQIHMRLQMGEWTQAEALLERLDAVGARHADTGASALGEIDVATARAHVRVDLALGRLDAAAARLAPLIARCEAHGQQRMATHLLALSAALDARRARPQEARTALLEALRRGHRLGLQRTVLAAHPGVRALLQTLLDDKALDPMLAFYAERLLVVPAPMAPPGTAASDSAPATPSTPAAAAATAAATASATPRPEIDALSDRETDILRLLAQAMPNKKIARALGLSPETVKWYLSRIYGKLRVAGRDEAVARMRDLDLLGAAQPDPDA